MRKFCALLLAWLVVLPTLARPADYARIVKDPDRHELQTSIRTFSRGSQTVDLVAAVHLAGPDYYRQLNQSFQDYDAVLFEMILDTTGADPDAPLKPAPAQMVEADNPLSATQKVLGDMLELEFQMERIDYSPDNLVHADLTLAEFHRAMAANQESPISMLLKIFTSKVEQTEDPQEQALLQEVDFLRVLLRGPTHRERQILRQVFAASIVEMSFVDTMEDSALLRSRNRKAIEVLEQRLEDGDRRLAVFYGAAHMQELENILISELGFELSRQRWLPAWNLSL